MKQEITGWQWHLLDHVQIICTSFQTDNHVSTSSPNFLKAGCCSWRPTNSVKVRQEDDNLPEMLCSRMTRMTSSTTPSMCVIILSHTDTHTHIHKFLSGNISCIAIHLFHGVCPNVCSYWWSVLYVCNSGNCFTAVAYPLMLAFV